MRPSEIAMTLTDLDLSIQKAVDHVIDILTVDFEPSRESNSLAEGETALVKSIVEYKITSTIASQYKKRSDSLKKMMDLQLASIEINPHVDSGLESTVFDKGNFHLTKKRSVATSSCSTKDLLTELNKLGVSKDLLDKAIDSASKEKQGNLYYIVSLE